VVVFGYREVGVECLEELHDRHADIVTVVTHADEPGETIWFPSVGEVASARGIPVCAPDDPNAPAFVEEVCRLRPDLIFSFYYRRLLSKALLDVPPLGAVNLHGSLLPKYRGRAPINWAILRGEVQTGVTIHYMDEQADHGDIIAQRPVPITVEDTAFTLSRAIAAAARSLLGEMYPLIVSGRALRVPQDHAATTRFGRRRPGDGLIDWRASDWQIYNLVRAVTRPFPGAFTYWGERRVMVWAARPPRDGREAGPPGRILGVGESGSLDVAAGTGALEILRLQVEGWDESDGAAFAAAVAGVGKTPGRFGGPEMRDV